MIPSPYAINPQRLAELKALPRCPVCKSLVKVCGGCGKVQVLK